VNDEQQKAVEKLVAEKLKRELAQGGAVCPDAGMLAAFVDRVLSLGERARLETHAASCQRCQEAIATLVKLAESDEPAPGGAPTRRRAFAAGRLAWAAPLLLAVVIVGVWRIGNFRSRLAEPQTKHSSPATPLPRPAAQETPRSANAPTPPLAPSSRGTEARKPIEKQAAPAGMRRDISKDKPSDMKVEAIPAPAIPAAAADNVTPCAGIAAPSVRARLVAPPPAPQLKAQGTSQGAGGGAVTSGAPAASESAQMKIPAETPDAKPPAAERGEKKSEVAAGALTKEMRTSAQQVEVTAAPTMELDVAPANNLRGAAWTVIRTRQSGTWRLGPGGAIQKQGKLGRWTIVPSGVTTDLYNLAFFGASEGWIVGQSGTVLHTTDGGKTWTAVTKPTNADLIQVAATAESAAQVTTRDGAIFNTPDGGATWNSATPK
jgi:photosynthesis system II assembly factor YCF48-like protein/putative zinc finger protein